MAEWNSTLSQHKAHVLEDGGAGYDVEYLENKLGCVQILICDNCHFVEAECLHEKNVWVNNNTKLECVLCGHDGT